MKFPLPTCGQVRPTTHPVGVCVRSRGTSDVRTTLHRLVIGIGIIGSLAMISPSAQEAPGQPQQTFRSAVDVVTIQASVRDARGRVVSRPHDHRFRGPRQRATATDSLPPIRSPVAAQSGDPGRHERQHADRTEDRDGAPGVRLGPVATAPRPGRSGAVYVRRVAPRAPGLHSRSPDTERRAVRFRVLRHDVSLRCDRRDRTPPRRPIGDAQGHHRAHRRHRHE